MLLWRVITSTLLKWEKMLDFHINVDDLNVNAVKASCEAINVSNAYLHLRFSTNMMFMAAKWQISFS